MTAVAAGLGDSDARRRNPSAVAAARVARARRSWRGGAVGPPSRPPLLQAAPRPPPARDLGEPRHGMEGAGRGLARLDEDRASGRILVERGGDHLGSDGAAPLDHHLVHANAIGLADLRPALAELATVDDDHLVA